jgi:hypothetical protein
VVYYDLREVLLDRLYLRAPYNASRMVDALQALDPVMAQLVESRAFLLISFFLYSSARFDSRRWSL